MSKAADRQWLISTVIPVYNVRPYIAQTVESVLAQTIGFTENIQIIFVDDGSTDGSRKLCEEYARRYPDNIVYIRQKNAGVSAARNNGKRHASGSYVHFLDSDDCITNDFYEQGVAFLAENSDTVDFVATKIRFFDANIDEHPNNYKFKHQRVINVDAEPDNPILHVSSCLFRREAIGDVTFDTKLTIAEDATFVSDVLRKKRAYGVLGKSALNYRKRSDGTSAVNNSQANPMFYTNTVKYFLKYLLDSWSREGSAKYAQYTVLYDLHWRIDQATQSVLGDDQERAYKKSIRDIAARIDDETIAQKKGMPVIQKRYLLQQKYGTNWTKYVSDRKGSYTIGETVLFDVRHGNGYIDFIHKSNDSWTIEGYVTPGKIHPKDKLEIHIGKNIYTGDWVERKQRQKKFLGDIVDEGGAFECRTEVPHIAHGTQKISLWYVTAGSTKIQLPLQTNRFSGMSVLPYSYRREGAILLRKSSGTITVATYSKHRTLLYESVYLLVIIANWRMHTLKERLSRLKRYNLHFLTPKQKIIELIKPFAFSIEAVAMIPRAIFLRLLYRIIKPFVRRPIWLIGDRGMAAGDNGEALYRYILSEKPDLFATVYFVIAKKSADYQRIKALGGKVVNQNSFRYKVLFLLASKVISSQADTETTNPFIRQIDHYVDLFTFDFVFLQHGIIRHDLSSWLNRFEKNIALFVTSAQKEYDSIINLPYYYEPRNVILSGLPRYDRLSSHPSGKLILAPTYRKNLVRVKTNRYGDRTYDTEFKKSAYFMFYNSFMNDKRLSAALKKHKMKGELYLHPVFSKQREDFEQNEVFTVKKFPYDYQKAFEEGDVLISDFSSVIFDFSYLKKPIVYSQFDRNSFFAGHSYDESDFFQDDRDGFGPVTYNLDSLVAETITAIEQNATMTKVYEKRVDSFFAHRDKQNCKRVYDAIQQM